MIPKRPIGFAACLLAALAFQSTALAASAWIGPKPSEARGFVLVVHGLNLRPSRMIPLAETICNPRTGLACRMVVLPGHSEVGDSGMSRVTTDSWKTAMITEIGDFMRRKRASKPAYFLGFSLGALVGPWAIQQLEEQPFSKLVLLAPPLETKFYARAALLIPGPSTMMIPSKNHPDYRVNDGTSLGAYRALFAIQDESRAGVQQRLNIETLALVNPRDELVSSSGLRKRVAASGWSKWRVETIPALRPRLDPVYQHLFIDEASMGTEGWKVIQSKILEFLGFSIQSH